MPPSNLLIFGASARAAAFSALRAGLRPWCADLFADVDLAARCPVQRVPADEYPHGFLEVVNQAPPGPWIYTGGLENRRALVRRLSRVRSLWGNDGGVLTRVRSPVAVQRILQAANLPCPAVTHSAPSAKDPRRWLVKPCHGAGGIGIRFWKPLIQRPGRQPFYFQEFIEGEAIAALFVGNGFQARFLGLTRQLVGETWLHARPFHYCGSIGPLPVEADLRKKLEHLGNALTGAGHLRGLFGVDCVLRDGVPWPVEINPRYTASVEVLEYATGLTALGLHGQVFDSNLISQPGGDPIATGPVIGKAILFAPTDLILPADGPWLAAGATTRPVQELPAFADLPAAGQPIRMGHPVLTFFARADSPADCCQALRQIASDLDRRLFAR